VVALAAGARFGVVALVDAFFLVFFLLELACFTLPGRSARSSGADVRVSRPALTSATMVF
jgi:hypothetical protein